MGLKIPVLVVSGLSYLAQASPLAGRDAATPVCSAWPYKLAQSFASYAPFQLFCSSRYPLAAVTVVSTVTPDPTTMVTTIFTTDVALATSISVQTDYFTSVVATATALAQEQAVDRRDSTSNGANAFLSTACSCIETVATTYVTVTADAITAFETQTFVVPSTSTVASPSTTTIEVDITTTITASSVSSETPSSDASTSEITSSTSTDLTPSTSSDVTSSTTTELTSSTTDSTTSSATAPDSSTDSSTVSTTSDSTTEPSSTSTLSDSTTSTFESSTSPSDSPTTSPTTSTSTTTSTPSPTPSNLITNGGFDFAVDGPGAVPYWAHSGDITVGHQQSLARSKTQYADFNSVADATIPKISQTIWSSTSGASYSLTFYYSAYNISGLEASAGQYCDLSVTFGNQTLPDIKFSDNVLPVAPPVQYVQYGPVLVSASQDAAVLGLAWDCVTHGGGNTDGELLVEDVSLTTA